MQDSLNKKQDIPSQVISSLSNNTMKHVKGLLLRKYREENHQFIVEGRKMVSEALSSGHTVDMLVFSETGAGRKAGEDGLRTDDAGTEEPASIPDPLLSVAMKKEIPCRITTDRIFKTISDTQTPQGVLAVVKEKEYNLEKVIGQTTGFLVLLDGVRDPGNLGAIVRTVDAAGGDGVILIHDCVDPYNPKAVRSTMGSVFRIPVFPCRDTAELIDKLIRFGYHIVTSHLNGSNIFKWQGGHARTALVIGSESHGVSQQMIDSADSLVKIPMAGGAESLNASVAAGILIYEIFRKGRKMDE